MNQKQIFITLVFTMLTALAFSACGAASASQAARIPQIPEITVKAADYSFEAPDQIEAGLVKVTLVNDGQEPHHAQLVRLNNGVTLEQFQAALQEGEAAAFPLITFVGGPGLVDPGLHSQVTLELAPGQYVLLCFVPSHDGMPHLAKGMVRPLEVVAATDKAQVSAPQPQADATVKLLDFAFVLPSAMKAGSKFGRWSTRVSRSTS